MLSFVNVMIAFGGKRENGALKANSDCMPVRDAACEEVATFRGGCEDRRERNVAKTVATKKRPAMRILGGLMMLESLRNAAAGPYSALRLEEKIMDRIRRREA